MTNPNQPPHQPYPGQPYAAWQPPPPKRRNWFARHKFLTVLGALVLLVLIGGIAGSGGGSESAPTANDTPADTPVKTAETTDAGAATAAGLGQPARDGKFEFTVAKVKCGVSNVGGEYGQTAQGQFCLVTVKVANIGDKPRTLDASSQTAYDGAGNKLSADSGAGIYANPDSGGAFLNDINPGNAVTAVLVFDIPKTAKLTRLELHDSLFSGGVTVDL